MRKLLMTARFQVWIEGHVAKITRYLAEDNAYLAEDNNLILSEPTRTPARCPPGSLGPGS
mgnify:CR=1 FL=1